MHEAWESQNVKHAFQPTKTALKCDFQGRKLVAGLGFEHGTPSFTKRDASRGELRLELVFTVPNDMF